MDYSPSHTDRVYKLLSDGKKALKYYFVDGIHETFLEDPIPIYVTDNKNIPVNLKKPWSEL